MQGKDPRDKFARRFLELAEKNPKDPVAVDALVWVVTQTGAVRKSDARTPQTKARKILLRDHVQSEKMELVCQTLGSSQDEDSQQLLKAVLEKSKHRPAQAQACLGLAQQAEGRLSLAQQFKDEPEMAKRYQAIMGTKAVAALIKAGPDKLSSPLQLVCGVGPASRAGPECRSARGTYRTLELQWTTKQGSGGSVSGSHSGLWRR
jgi:hypothetical protein